MGVEGHQIIALIVIRGLGRGLERVPSTSGIACDRRRIAGQEAFFEGFVRGAIEMDFCRIQVLGIAAGEPKREISDIARDGSACFDRFRKCTPGALGDDLDAPIRGFHL